VIARRKRSTSRNSFIAAETIAFQDLITLGSPAKAREAGKLRIEGKEYTVQDGGVIEFRFNV
jgi:ribosome-binding ATPase YchF (GTP1/OBG family)